MAEFFKTGLTQQQFLEQYWQKKPLLIRQAFPLFESPISPNDLAGLACETDIESRLIIERAEQWEIQYGPFTAADFEVLPKSHWTVLVQDVDKHVPELQPFLSPFDFIPAWRRDDLMVSYAVDGGSVGPHTDGYDVFLLQASGTRRWQVTEKALQSPKLVDNCDLQILAEFEHKDDWQLEAGDMLYLPPHFGHLGVAMGECMTYSIGFRAPKQTEMLDALLVNLAEQSLGEQHYQDEALDVCSHPNEIDQHALLRFKQQLHDAIDLAEPVILETFGRLLTETKPSLENNAHDFIADSTTVAEMAKQFEQGKVLHRNPYYRVAWARQEEGGVLFLAGESYSIATFSTEIIAVLADKPVCGAQDWQLLNQSSEGADLMCLLMNEGAWYWQ